MTEEGAKRSRLREWLHPKLQGATGHFALWIVPVAVALFTLFALLGLPSLYPSHQESPLYFRSLPLEAGHRTPGEAAAALQTMPQRKQAAFHDGAWIAIELPELARTQPTAIDFPARGAEAITCWRRDTMQKLGSVRGRQLEGAMRANRVGYALMLGQNETYRGASFTDLVCEARYSRPVSFTAALWSIPELRAASDHFHRGVALLDGGMATLAVFLAILALRTREWAYLLAAAWVVGNLRLGSYALGWDSLWFGHVIPAEWQPTLRNLTLAAYFLVTLSLFARLFPQESSRHPAVFGAMQAAGFAQLAAAAFLPWAVFQPLGAVIWAAAVGTMLQLLGRNVTSQPQRLVSLHFLALAAATGIVMTSLVLTLLGQDSLFDSYPGIVAVILANVLVALTVVNAIRNDTKQRLHTQTRLVASYALAPLGMFTLDARKGRFVQMDPIMREMLGLKEDSGTLPAWADFFAPQNWSQVVAATAEGRETEIHMAGERGSPQGSRHFALRAAMVGSQIEGSLQDITARTQAMSALRDMVDNDPLTNTLNRRGIEKQLEQVLTTLQQDSGPSSLAYMDLDHFKRINGLFGHTSGDEILKQVSAKLRQILTEKQPLGRIGSDEFVILFPGMGADDARRTAEQIIESLNDTSYQVGHRYFHVRSAIGVVELHAGMDAPSAISAASRACRDARKHHQDVVVYAQDSTELQAHAEELRLFDQLEGGASPKGLYLEMQPIMALHHPDESLNFEILLRVRDSQGRLIPTGQIVSSAEENGTVTIIDKWVVAATLEWLAKHESQLRKTQFVNVNLSGVSLNDDKFIENMFRVFNRHPHLTRRLCMEITEGVALQNLERTQRLIARLRRMGVRIALDDFGAGYTSFNYLKQLDADVIKIDGTLVRDMLASETSTAIVRTIVELAQNLGMTSIAEWVEDVQTLEALREMGVDYVQGYVVSPALTPMEILDAEKLSDLVGNPDTLAYIRRNSPPPTLTLLG